MKKRIDRLNHFGSFRSPTPDEEGYQATMDYIKERQKNNPNLQKVFEKKYQKASSIAYTQSKNGIGFIQDKELRFFHAEFNERTWKYGFGAMPSAFNILEGFFKWNPDLFFFELYEEVEHLLSFYDFIDFVTSNKCSNSIDYFIENVENELIYSYNILNDVKDISFSTKDSKEYVIGGVSFIRLENEVFMLLVAGEIGDIEEFSKNLPELDSGKKIKSYINPAEGRKREAIKLFDRKDIWKVNIYIRIDINKKTIDSRYIQKDIGSGFWTFTDDYGMLERTIKDKDTLQKLIKEQSEEIINYAAIFEVAYNCLHLPEYFDFYDDQILPEVHPTDLFGETIRKAFTKIKPEYNSHYFFKTKDVWVLDRSINPAVGKSVLKQTELKITKDGYWQYLEPGKVGTDKNGNAIHSRTWVEKTLTWRESIPEQQEVKITIPNTVSQNNGFIYILRNATHELDLFKIGLTTKTVEERARQLSGTSSPDKFAIINRWQVNDCVLAEKLIHERLDAYRINPAREFFKIPLEEAIKIISPIISEINSNN